MHSTETQLALYSTGELGLVERLRVRMHLGGCERCRQQLASFEEALAFVGSEVEQIPPGWDRLAAEMTANIRLGVEAGECVRIAPRSAAATISATAAMDRAVTQWNWHAIWRPGLAMASLVLMLYAGTWVVARRMTSPKHSAPQQMTLEARPDSLEIRGEGTAFSLVRASAAPVAMSVGMGGSLAAREMDEDTGQVTIYNVYAQ